MSYKEDSDEDKTGSEDIVEVEWNEAETPVEADNAETIEKVIAYRRGKKGGKWMLFVCGFIFLVKTSKLPLKILWPLQWLIQSYIVIFRVADCCVRRFVIVL